MKFLIVLCALVACACATTHDDKCGPLQRIKVKQQWLQAYGAGHHRVDFGVAMWRGVFVQDPKARDLFKRVNGEDIHSATFTAHSMRVLNGLSMLIAELDDEPTLDAALAHLKIQHDERGISAGNFKIFKNSLLKVVPAAIGRCFDEEAWDHCFDVMATGITG